MQVLQMLGKFSSGIFRRKLILYVFILLIDRRVIIYIVLCK